MWEYLFNKVSGRLTKTLLKRDSDTSFVLRISRIFKNIFSVEQLLAAAPEVFSIILGFLSYGVPRVRILKLTVKV